MIEPNNFDIAYSSLTDCYYVVIGKEKYDITNFVKGKIQQGRADALKELKINLDGDIGAYSNAGLPLEDIYGWIANYISIQIKEQK